MMKGVIGLGKSKKLPSVLESDPLAEAGYDSGPRNQSF